MDLSGVFATSVLTTRLYKRKTHTILKMMKPKTRSNSVPVKSYAHDNKDLGINKPLYTHTHPFNGPFSGTTWVSQYQKGKTNLDFTKARDSEWQWH